MTSSVKITELTAASTLDGTEVVPIVQSGTTVKATAVQIQTLAQTNVPAANITGTLAVSKGGTGVTTSTGSGDVVLSDNPTLTSPNLGTPSAVVLTNATGFPLEPGTTVNTADYQIVMGTGAMPNATAGSAKYNIAIGTEALRDTTTNYASVAIGYHAAASHTTGRTGTYIGHVAGEFVTTGSSNTFVGGYAGRGWEDNPVTGNNNVFVGEAAGLNIGGAGPNGNIGIGFNALFGLGGNVGGDYHTAVGYGSGLCVTSSTGNTLYGIGSYGWNNGSNNVMIGYNAGKGVTFTLTTAGGTTPSGGDTIYFTDTSSLSVGMKLYSGGAIRVGATITSINPNVSVTINLPHLLPLVSPPTFNDIPPGSVITVIPDQHVGNYNVFMGYYAGNSLQGSVADTVGIGYSAMRLLTTGLRNTALGGMAGYSLTTQNDVTSIGYRAGRYITGDDNTAVGSQAMRGVSGNLLTGTNNTAVGSDAMADIQGAAASNTAIGNAAGLNITTGSRNTLVGANVAASLTTGSDNIIIGPSINIPGATTSNYLNIGSAIYGTGINGGTVKIGINKSAPEETLHVGGNLKIDGTFASGAVLPPTTTWASLVSPGTAGTMTFVTDAGAKGSMWVDDGTRWKPLNGIAALKSLDTASSSIDNTATIVLQYQMPANFWKVGDRIRLYAGFAKSGTTDNMTLAVRVGTTGTTSDNALVSTSVLQSTYRQGGLIMDFRLESATTVQNVPAARGTTALPFGYGNNTTTAADAPITISNVSNSLYVSVIIFSSGTTDTVQLIDGRLEYVSSAN